MITRVNSAPKVKNWTYLKETRSINPEFSKTRQRRERFHDPESLFKANIFYRTLDFIINLISNYEIISNFSVLQILLITFKMTLIY